MAARPPSRWERVQGSRSAAVTAALDADTQLYGLTAEGVAVAVRRALLAACGPAAAGEAGA